jgi:hypothetical protein
MNSKDWVKVVAFEMLVANRMVIDIGASSTYCGSTEVIHSDYPSVEDATINCIMIEVQKKQGKHTDWRNCVQ